MPLELVGIDAFIYQTLHADATLNTAVGGRIFCDIAPDKDPATGLAPAFPMALFGLNSGGRDTVVLGGTRIMATPLYLVKIVGQGSSFAGLQAVADRIDALLSVVSPTLVTVGGQTFNVRSVREHPMQMTEVGRDGNRYQHLGGLFRFYVS